MSNLYQTKNNIFRNGEYAPDISKAMKKERATNIVPSLRQEKFRNDLYKFCVQNGLIRDGFPLGRTKKQISANIRAFITILRKNGLHDEFFNKCELTAEVDDAENR